jgi:hypothetical protein
VTFIDRNQIKANIFLAAPKRFMLRGGAFLLQKDYRVHEYFLNDVVKNAHNHHSFELELQLSMDPLNFQGIYIPSFCTCRL